MKAVVVAALGDADGLQLRDRPDPTPGPGQVLIQVETTGLNFADVNARRGRYPHRLPPLPFIPGLEAAGVIAAVGSGVSGLAVGQRVAAFPEGGSYAERVVARADLTYPLPDTLDFVRAGGFLVVTQTAYHLLTTAGRLRPGESVLVHAAAGGVGTVLLQLARTLGAGCVLGTAGSADKVSYALQFGADAVFNYTEEDFGQRVLDATGGRGVDLVLDAVGGAARQRSLDVLAPFGRLVMYGNASAEPELAISSTLLRERVLGALGFNLTMLRRAAPELLRASADELVGLLTSGRLRLDVTEVFGLSDAAAAHRCLEERTSRGKLVLQVGAHRMKGTNPW